jgi:Predicted acyltransferases
MIFAARLCGDSMMLIRMREIDVMRSLAIILIVFSHLHFFADLGMYNFPLLTISSYLSWIGLGIFFFVSGFGLYNKNKDIDNLASFYKRRLLRIYPLYWFAILVFAFYEFFLGSFPMFTLKSLSPYMLAITVAGIQGFVPNYPGGLLWFVGVIIMFYIIYPLLIHPKKTKRLLILYILLFIILAIIAKLHLVQMNIWNYYLTFVIGIMANKMLSEHHQIPKQLINMSLVIFILCSGVYFAVKIFEYINGPVPSIIIGTLIPLIAVCGSLVIYNNIKKFSVVYNSNIISRISFCSFAIYLFHGPILNTFAIILTHYKISTLMILIALPIMLIICYYIQKTEVRFVNWLGTLIEGKDKST